MNEADYNKLLEIAKKDKNLIGLVLGGSRGKHAETEHSDYDVYLIVKDKSLDSYKNTFGIEAFTLDELKNKTPMWDRYNFTYLQPVIDNSKGELQEVINFLGRLSEVEQKQAIAENLDTYINYFYRSFKNSRDGREFASKLDAAESLASMLTVVFALEGQIRPYNKYFEWELQKHPFTKLSMDGEEFIKLLQKIVNSGDIDAQKKIYFIIEPIAREQGYGNIYDAWDNDLEIFN